MNKYTFIEGFPAKPYKSVFERFLFNEDRHRRSQSEKNWNTFSFIDEHVGQIVAQIHFCIVDGIALSPCNAPFGSIEFAEELDPESFALFLNEVEKRLKAIGVKKFVIKDTPHQYRPHQSTLLSVLLLNHGFTIRGHEINSAIVVDTVDWENKIPQAKLRNLKRCRKEKLEFRCLGIERLSEIYQFIESCRRERGVTLSMSQAQLRQTIDYCKDDFILFGVYQQDELVAASISVRVNERIVYNFYPAHAKKTDSLSPLVFLIDNEYQYCRERNIGLIDLGTSMLSGEINFSLLNFKTQLDGKPSLKLTFEKDI